MNDDQTVDHKGLLLSLLGSLSLCGHMGDVANEVVECLEKLGYSDGEIEELFETDNGEMDPQWFGHRGIRTLRGIEL